MDLNPLKSSSFLICALVCAVFAGCAGAPSPELDAVFWHQKAPEYQASTINVFSHARLRLDQALADPQWTAAVEQMDDAEPLPDKTAIILDIDETVLNNSPLYARKAKDAAYDIGKGWSDWTAEARAIALAGAVDFIKYALKRDVAVFFVSNRSCDQDDATRKNMTDVGFPSEGIFFVSRNTAFDDPDAVISCPQMESYAQEVLGVSDPVWTLAKSRRRAAIAKKYRILLLFGDSQGDFYNPLPGSGISEEERKRILQAHLTPAEREDIQRKYGHYFKNRWMALPNAMYGSWLSGYLGYENLNAKEQVRRQLELLSTE